MKNEAVVSFVASSTFLRPIQAHSFWSKEQKFYRSFKLIFILVHIEIMNVLKGDNQCVLIKQPTNKLLKFEF